MATEEQQQVRGRMLLALTVLALLAVADGAWLTYVHVNLSVGKPGVAQVCHALSKDGCSVTAGEYGAIAGVPVSVIGMAGAMATLVVGVIAFVRRRESYEPFRVAALVLAAVSVLASIIMAGLSAKAGSYCPFCVAWYGINAAMAYAAWSAVTPAYRKPGEAVRMATGAPLLAMVATFSLTLAAGVYFEGGYMRSLLDERDAFLRLQIEAIREQGKTELPLELIQGTGPEDAEVVIVEVADFQCPFCRRLWDAVHQYKAGTKRSVRTAFVHYPLDTKCNRRLEHGAHEYACEAAYAAECAANEGKFFEYGALLFDGQPKLAREDLLGYAGELGLDTGVFETCLQAPETRAKVRKSIELARTLKVKATPTFFVNGYKFEGARRPAMLEAIIETLVAADERDAKAP
ncbi:MAG: thioredoxin domain-containing protein [Myxococcota bacterium]